MTRSTRRARCRTLGAAILAVALLGGCGGGNGPAAGSSPPATTTTSGPAVSPTPSAPAITPTTTAPTTTPARGHASAQVAAFFSAAAAADTRLREAARAINAGVTADAVTISPKTVRAVRAAAPFTAGRRIPAGMPPALLRAVLVVQSDLVARYFAMSPVLATGDDGAVLPRPGPADTSPSAQELFQALRNGSAPAARFPRDLRAARAAAAASPSFVRQAPDSRAAAEVAVRLGYIDGANGGCAGTGGQVFTDLVPLTWDGGRAGSWFSGRIAGVAFRTTFGGGAWRVSIQAC